MLYSRMPVFAVAICFLAVLGCSTIQSGSIPKDRVFYINQEMLLRNVHLSMFPDNQIGIGAFSSNYQEYEAVIRKDGETEKVRYKHPLEYQGVNILDRSTTRVFSKVVVQNPRFHKYKLVKRVYLDESTVPFQEEAILVTMIDFLELDVECPMHKNRLVRMAVELVRLPEVESRFRRSLQISSLIYLIQEK